jgi:hypothetical protein
MDHRLSMGFNKPISRLAFGWSGDNFRIVVDQILRYGTSKQFGIAVAVETMGKAARGSPKEA